MVVHHQGRLHRRSGSLFGEPHGTVLSELDVDEVLQLEKRRLCVVRSRWRSKRAGGRERAACVAPLRAPHTQQGSLTLFTCPRWLLVLGTITVWPMRERPRTWAVALSVAFLPASPRRSVTANKPVARDMPVARRRHARKRLVLREATE